MKTNIKLYFENIVRKYGLIFIDIVINNNKAKMLLDTGSTDNVIDINFIKSIGIEVPKSQKKIMNSFNDEQEFESSEISLNNISIENSFNTNVKFSVMDLTKTMIGFKNDFGLDIKGILGNIFLINNDMVINYKENYLEYENYN